MRHRAKPPLQIRPASIQLERQLPTQFPPFPVAIPDSKTGQAASTQILPKADFLVSTPLRTSRFAAVFCRMSISAAHADAFASEAVASDAVWTIKDATGFPTSTNSSGEIAMPFWSTETRARRIIAGVDAYRDFEPVRLELGVFIERWLPGLARDGLVVGLNWSGERATGYDMQPVDVTARLLARA